MYRLPYQSRSW